MKTYRVSITQRCQEQLAEIYQYIAANASPVIAERYVSAIYDYCEGLNTFPLRGLRREDLLPRLRFTSDRRGNVIAYTVEGDDVLILGVFHGGQDYEAWLVSDSIDAPYAVDNRMADTVHAGSIASARRGPEGTCQA